MMRSNKIVAAGLGIAVAFAMTAGVGVAQAGVPGSEACATAQQNVLFAQAELRDASSTRTRIGNQVTAQRTARQSAINAGNVELVGQINVQLGSSTATYNTVDSAVATGQARVNRNKAAATAAC